MIRLCQQFHYCHTSFITRYVQGGVTVTIFHSGVGSPLEQSCNDADNSSRGCLMKRRPSVLLAGSVRIGTLFQKPLGGAEATPMNGNMEQRLTAPHDRIQFRSPCQERFGKAVVAAGEKHIPEHIVRISAVIK